MYDVFISKNNVEHRKNIKTSIISDYKNFPHIVCQFTLLENSQNQFTIFVYLIVDA